MMRGKFYVCPVCGNIIYSTGEAVISCHGINLSALEAEDSNNLHKITIEKVEDEYFVSIHHEMTKQHYISFIAAVSLVRVQIVKTYPENTAETRFKINGVREIFFCCNRDGLFRKKGECLPCNLNMNENLHCFTVLYYNLVTGTLIGFHFC